MLPSDFTLSSPQEQSLDSSSGQVLQYGSSRSASSNIPAATDQSPRIPLSDFGSESRSTFSSSSSEPRIGSNAKEPQAAFARPLGLSKDDSSPLKATREFLQRQQQQLLLWEEQCKQRRSDLGSYPFDSVPPKRSAQLPFSSAVSALVL
jgi:hypothetical protein